MAKAKNTPRLVILMAVIIAIIIILLASFTAHAAKMTDSLLLQKGTTAKVTTWSVGSDEIRWTSSNPKIASVDEYGNVSALKAGKANIYARYVKPGKNKSLRCRVTVVNKISTKASTIHKRILQMRKKYPNGMRFTDNYPYGQHAAAYRAIRRDVFPSYCRGCAAFAWELSDHAYGTRKPVRYTNYKKIRVGDVLKIEQGQHWAIVLKIDTNKIYTAEANVSGKVSWKEVYNKKYMKQSFVEGWSRN